MSQPNQISRELLDPLLGVVGPIAQRFADEGHRLYLVGGIVRDLLLASAANPGATPVAMSDSHDVDLTTDANPATIKRLAKPGADAIWTQGERFGTIGIRVGQHDLEITTHRAESYDPSSRKPVVTFGRDLHEDLSRRDFTINAIALDAQDATFADPFNGTADLAAGLLRTPLGPQISFEDDPLRMLRAARFIARFNLSASPDLVAAAADMAERLAIVSVERQAVELERLLELPDPTAGFDFLQSAGVISELLSELKTLTPDQTALACRLGATSASVTVRRVGLVWPTRSIATLERLRYSNTDQKATEGIVDALDRSIGSANAESFDAAAARRIVVSIGLENLPTFHQAAEAIAMHDPTVADDAASKAKAVFDGLATTEDLNELGSPLSGAEIIETLQIEPGPQVGQAERFLKQWRLDKGPITPTEAKELLRSQFL